MMRLFVAVYPPADAARAMLATLEGMDLPAHRVTSLEQVHMTLQFIGDRHERELESVIESVERSCAGIGAFKVTPRSLMSIPQEGTVRLLAVETDARPGLLEIQRRLAHRLTDPKRRRSGKFLPHVTVCRFAEDVRMERVERAVEVPAFEVGEVRLMSSLLRVGGAEHRCVRLVGLEGR